MPSITRLLGASLALLSAITSTSASPLFNFTGDHDAVESALLSRAIPPGLQLNILPIGDSLTAGMGSSTANAYRLNLKFFLQAAGWNVDFRGTQTLGENNPDNQHEGYGGFRINMILDKIRNNKILSEQQNLILIHAGTNDNNGEEPGESYADAPNRYGRLLDYVLCHAPNAVVIIAQLVQNKHHPTETNNFNAAVPGIVFQRQAVGQKVQLVDMSVIGGDELADIVHPNDNGYYHMAQLWYNAIVNIPDNWWSSSNPATYNGREQYCRDRGIF